MIEFHADDFGMFPSAAGRIIECINEGSINGISIMPNGPCFDECMQMLQSKCHKDIRIAIHLNLMTEKPLSDPEKIPDLVDEQGFLCASYKKLLAASFLPYLKKRYKEQIKEELKKQIERCLPYDISPLRIDSHRHFHMIPVVFDSLSELIAQEHYTVGSVRIIREKSAYYKRLRKFECFRPVNVIKVLLLNFLGRIDKKRHPDLYGKATADFASILFSGCMTEQNVRLLIGNISAKRDGRKEDIELMFHPGAVSEIEDLERIHDPEDAKYMSDEMRYREKEAVMKSYAI